MQQFDNIGDAREAIMDYPVNALPDFLRERYRTLRKSPAPVDQVVNLGEFLFANRANVDDEGKALAAGLIQYATTNAWYGLLIDERGDRIVQALQRDLGEKPPTGVTWPEAATDPRGKEALIVDPPRAQA